jgi:Cu+-exporting ATPase
MPVSVLTQPQNPKISSQTCFHCHDLCADERFRAGDKVFCCQGCQMVYEILNEHNLCTFYDLDKNAGISLKDQKSAKSYAYLDDPEVQDKLLEFQTPQLAQVSFFLPQMHCVSCIWLLENLYKLDRGVAHSRVNFLKKTTTIQFNPEQTSLRKLAALLHTIGYAPDINLGDLDSPKDPLINRRLAYQIGIAGFVFGNVMLFSFPEYVGMSRENDPWFSQVFGYLSLALAMPVLLYSARDYFVSAWQGLRNRQLNIDIPLCLALLSLFGRSVWEILTQTGPGYLDSFAGLTFLLLTGKWFQQRVWHRLSFERDYKSYFPVAATVRDGQGEETSVPVNRLVPGDIIVVRSHEIIPADGILLKGTAQIDYSFVTGESAPVTVNSGEKIFAGGKQTGESIEIALTRRVAQSHLTKLWNNEAFKPEHKGQVTKLADAAGRYFTWIILAFGTASTAYWWGLKGDVATAINAFTAVMIVACPCIIALSIPFTLGNILRILGNNRLYLKNIRTVEAFSEIDTVVFDKTGTIMETGGDGHQLTGGGGRWVVAIKSLVRHSTHPLSRWLYGALPGIAAEKVEQYEEMPGLGIKGTVNGQALMVGSYEFLAGAGVRGLGEKQSGAYAAVDGEAVAHFASQNRLRSGLEKVLAYFRGLPTKKKQAADMVRTYLLSGDQDRDAAALAAFFPEPDAMYFGQSPQDKLDFVKNLQQKGQKVMMIGDGLNDAGALRQSELGVVVAENTNNFTPACDAIIHAGEFERLPKLVELARTAVRIVNRSYAVALTYNAIGLGFAVSGALSPLVAAILMPTSSISVVLFGVGMGNLAARRIMR